MSRQYTLKKRAEQVAETRRRIVEAAVDLHGTVGPAATTLSMIAERAGVQRHTLYAHFPEERSLYLACSGLALERDPLPQAESWADIENVRERLRQGLSAVYGWYARNDELAACVLRDAEHHALTREIAELRFGQPFADYRQVLGAGLTPPQQALVAVALNFHAWRTLAHETPLSPTAAAELFADAIAAMSSSDSAPNVVDASRRRDGRRRNAVS
ncbi:MAG TPA: helix-turn-helix domain-containing protein [Steroidobacteraceae bacterium]|nr:helix-turn-helix domain-containing protein [Steroidobacteraceae bacterium]